MAAYMASSGTGQTSDEVALSIMNHCVLNENPPVKVQTNPGIQSIFEMQKTDTSGASGVDAATARFLTPAAPASS